MENLTTSTAQKRKQVDTPVKNQDLISNKQRVVVWKYDVFVSFRGEDIRKSFIDHLFNAFKRNGIQAFKDNTELPRGEAILPQLLKAIKSSRFLMVVFSKNYASSSWCLRELVEILKAKHENPKHQVRTLFYDVDPEVVRKQTGTYAEAFAKCEILNRTEVDEWRKALTMAASLSGWHLDIGYESKLISIITKELCKILCDGPLHVAEKLVGVDSRVDKLNLMRFHGSNKVNMIGICGISGIGKTIFAKAIYNKMYSYFERSCFCEDVQVVAKRHDLTQVQTQLINKIKECEDVKISSTSEGIVVLKKTVACQPILLVLDDVDHREQLEALAGSRHWFCPGSLIIFTSKDKQLLRSHGMDEIFEIEYLSANEAIDLFCLYAFDQTYPTHDFNDLACQVVKHLQGHPLALKVVGSALFGKPELIWRSNLEKLQMYPNPEIQQILRPTFELLDFGQKRVFLDIACSLIGENRDLSASVLDVNYSADADIDVLVDKSLITISQDENLQMHELIRSMAKGVLREDSYKPIRLCGLLEVYAVLCENNETETTKAIEVLVLSLEKSTRKFHTDCKAFSKMKKLRILKICHPEPKEDFGRPFQLSISMDFNVNFSGSLEFLSNELRLIYWHGYPFKFLPSKFYPENVVTIDLSYSNIKTFWTTPKCFKRLKVMKLRHCRNLRTTPDFTQMENLEKLILEGCVSLVKLHPSIGMLKKLVMLNLKDCIQIKSLPCKDEMDSLQDLILPKVDNLTLVSGTLKSLVKLYVHETAITEFPSFMSSITNLQALHIGGYQQTVSPTWWTSIFQKQPKRVVLPSLACLRFLTDLRATNCNISEVCPDIGALSCLRCLSLSGNNFCKLPESLSQLSRLKVLFVDGCKKLEVLKDLPPNVEGLYATQCTSLIELPTPFHRQRYSHSEFIGCPKIFGNVTQVAMSQSRLIDSATSSTSHVSTSPLSYLVVYWGIRSRMWDFFTERRKRLDILFEGNRIPQWFTNKSYIMGNCHDVRVELPPNWSDARFKGFGICVVFTLKRGCTRIRPLGFSVNNFNGASLVRHSISLLGGDYLNTFGIHDTDMIWLYIKTRSSGWEEARRFVTFSLRDINEDIIEVKQCGVRLVCDDAEDLLEDGTTVLSMIQQLPVTEGYFRFTDGFDFISFSW